MEYKCERRMGKRPSYCTTSIIDSESIVHQQEPRCGKFCIQSLVCSHGSIVNVISYSTSIRYECHERGGQVWPAWPDLGCVCVTEVWVEAPQSQARPMSPVQSPDTVLGLRNRSRRECRRTKDWGRMTVSQWQTGGKEWILPSRGTRW